MNHQSYKARQDEILNKVGDLFMDKPKGMTSEQVLAEAAAALDALMLEVSNWAVEPCEPDCDDVRHARHQGSWDTGERIRHIIGGES